MSRSLISVLALAVAVFVTGCRESSRENAFHLSFKGKTLTVAGFGGVTEQQMKALAARPFEELTGGSVRFVEGTSSKHLEALTAAKGKEAPPFDVVLLDGIIQELAAQRALLHGSSRIEIPLIEQLLPQAKPERRGGPAFQFYSVGIVYDPAALSEAGIAEPSSWSDLWNPKLRGHVAIPSIHHTAGMDCIYAASRKLGTDPYTLEGLKAGVNALADLRAKMVYERVADLREAFRRESIWIAPLYNSRAYNWIAQQKMRARYCLPKEKGFGHLTTVNVVKGSKNKEVAEAFINLLLTRGYQYAQAIETPYGPVRKDIIAPLAHFPEVVKRFPLGEDGLNDLCRPNWEKLNRFREEITEYFKKKVLEKK
mgnify:CR=1 FL=1